MRIQIEKSFDNKTETQLLEILRSQLCMRFIANIELRPIAVTLLKRLKYIPKRYLELLTKYDCMTVRINDNFFLIVCNGQ